METSNTITFLEASIGLDDTDTVKNDYEYYLLVVNRLLKIRAYIVKYLDDLGLFKDEMSKMSVAIEEALVNAAMHGNLERTSALRDSDDRNVMVRDLVEHCNRKMHTRRVRMTVELGVEEEIDQPSLQEIVVRLTAEKASVEDSVEVLDQFSMRVVSETINSYHIKFVRFIIEDEGNGFKPEEVPDPTQPENLTKAHGRGLLLMQSFMDRVEYSEGGRRVALCKDVKQKA